MNKQSILQNIFIVLAFVCLTAASAFAQTTAFSYQGRLSESGAPVTGSRLFQFTLFDENGAAIPGAVVNQTLTVTNGVFNTNLDFGAAAFPGANRSLEIAVKINAGDAFTILNPRQAILAAPYSTKSKTADAATNAAQLGGIDATRFIKSDTGGNVSLNGNLAVSGTTTFDTVNAATQFNLGGQRALASDSGGNLLVGTNSGDVPTPKSSLSGFGKSLTNASTGLYNTFLGNFAGLNNATGSRNTFVGNSTGFRNTTGNFNSFFGVVAGASNMTGSENAFFGDSSGGINTTGEQNVFLGTQAGSNNTTGNRNTITGFNSGGGCFTFPCPFALTGSDNAFYGYSSGLKGTTGTRNSFFGGNSGVNNSTGNDNSFFGYFAGQSNTTGDRNAFFGISAGNSNLDGCCNSFFGNKAGLGNLSGRGNSFFGGSAGRNNTVGNFNSFFGDLAGSSLSSGTDNTFVGNISGLTVTTGSFNTFLGSNTNGANNLTNATAIGANAVVSQSNALILGNNANVGIGTSTPNSKLTVVGLIETTTGGVKFPDGTIQTTAGGGGGTITGVTAGTGLTGGGTSGNVSLAISNLGVTNALLANSTITAPKIAAGQVVKSFNGLTDNLTLTAGSNITITPSGNTLTIASTGGGSGGILNQTTTQAGANFNISGNGTASAFFANFVAADDYRNGSGDTSILNSIGGVLRVGLDAGIGAGGNQNTFVGNNSADNAGTSGNNTFVGYQSGRLANGTTGSNSFFGAFTGNGTQGGFNSFFGANSGQKTTTGAGNVFVGWQAGFENTNGSNNTVIGNNAGVPNGSTNLNDATAIGANAVVSQSNSLVLGSVNGVNGGVDTRIGIGTTAPKARLDVTGGNILVASPGQGMILKSPNGATCKLLSIDNAGAMVSTAVACP